MLYWITISKELYHAIYLFWLECPIISSNQYLKQQPNAAHIHYMESNLRVGISIFFQIEQLILEFSSVRTLFYKSYNRNWISVCRTFTKTVHRSVYQYNWHSKKVSKQEIPPLKIRLHWVTISEVEVSQTIVRRYKVSCLGVRVIIKFMVYKLLIMPSSFSFHFSIYGIVWHSFSTF